MCCFCFGSSKKDYPFNIGHGQSEEDLNSKKECKKEDSCLNSKDSEFELVVENLSIKRVPKALANLMPLAALYKNKPRQCYKRGYCHNAGKYQVPAEQLAKALLNVKNDIDSSSPSEEIRKTESVQAEVEVEVRNLKDQSAGPDISNISEEDLPQEKKRPKSSVEKFLASHPQNQQQKQKQKKSSLPNKAFMQEVLRPPSMESEESELAAASDADVVKQNSVIMLKGHKYDGIDKMIFRRAADLTKSLASEKVCDNIESQNARQSCTAAFHKSDLKKFLTPPQFDFFSRRNIPPPKLIESNKKFKKVMSPDLKETIDSLRYSQPPKKLPGFPPRNQRTVRESSSPNRISFSHPLSKDIEETSNKARQKNREKSALPLKRIMVPQHFDKTTPHNIPRPVSQPKPTRAPSNQTRHSSRARTESQVNLREERPSPSHRSHSSRRATADSPRRRHRSTSRGSRSRIYSLKDPKQMHLSPKSSADAIGSSKRKHSDTKRHNARNRRDKSPSSAMRSNNIAEKNKKDLKWKIIIKQHPKI